MPLRRLSRAWRLQSLLSMTHQAKTWLLGFLAIYQSSASASAVRTEFYSEGVLEAQAQPFHSGTFARFSLFPENSVQPFLQAGAEMSVGPTGEWEPYFSPGVSWSIPHLRCFAEHRLKHKAQWRFLTAFGDLWSWKFAPRSILTAFLEPYSEVLMAVEEDAFWGVQAFSRMGIQVKMLANGFTELYLEPFWSFWQKRGWGPTQSGIRPSIRLRVCDQSFCAAVSAAHVIPFQDSGFEGFRLLATIGGSI